MSTNKKTGKKQKLSGPEQVAEFMKNLEHSFKEEIEEVRNIILSTNSRISEKIKWNAPSFCVDDEDRITFNLRGNGFFGLVFHCGAEVKENIGNGRLFVDTTGTLEWITNDRAIMKFTDKEDVKAKEEKLREVITKWIDATN